MLNKLNSKLYLISGPSGSGKSSIARTVMNNEVISFTTRAPRPGEVNGSDYLFISDAEFDLLYRNNGLAEYTDYYGTAKYGITMSELVGRLRKGNAFVVVDVVGKRQLQSMYHNCLSIFMWMPYIDKAETRMRLRGDSEENIQKRLKTYSEELNNFSEYDILLDNNGSFQMAVQGFDYLVRGGNLQWQRSRQKK
jgi:guanylate kinase